MNYGNYGSYGGYNNRAPQFSPLVNYGSPYSLQRTNTPSPLLNTFNNMKNQMKAATYFGGLGSQSPYAGMNPAFFGNQYYY